MSLESRCRQRETLSPVDGGGGVQCLWTQVAEAGPPRPGAVQRPQAMPRESWGKASQALAPSGLSSLMRPLFSRRLPRWVAHPSLPVLLSTPRSCQPGFTACLGEKASCMSHPHSTASTTTRASLGCDGLIASLMSPSPLCLHLTASPRHSHARCGLGGLCEELSPGTQPGSGTREMTATPASWPCSPPRKGYLEAELGDFLCCCVFTYINDKSFF